MISVLPQRALKATLLAILKWRKRFVRRAVAPTKYYFAYGANLDPNRFDRYQMNYTAEGVAHLPGFELTFTFPCEYLGKGYGDVTGNPSSTVWGYLYRFDGISFFLLDVLEWAAFNQYKRVWVSVVKANGETVKAQVYQARYPRPGLSPSKVYLAAILKGCDRHGFPADYRARLAQVATGDHFPLDPTFSFLHPHRPRLGSTRFRKIYLYHDRFRERVCDWLRF